MPINTIKHQMLASFGRIKRTPTVYHKPSHTILVVIVHFSPYPIDELSSWASSPSNLSLIGSWLLVNCITVRILNVQGQYFDSINLSPITTRRNWTTEGLMLVPPFTSFPYPSAVSPTSIWQQIQEILSTYLYCCKEEPCNCSCIFVVSAFSSLYLLKISAQLLHNYQDQEQEEQCKFPHF